MKVFVAFSLLVALAVAAQAYSLEEILEKYAAAKKAGKVHTNAHTATSHSHQGHSQSNVAAARARLNDAAKKSTSHSHDAMKKETSEERPAVVPGRGMSHFARCDMVPATSDDEKITGNVTFHRGQHGTEVVVDLAGFTDYPEGSAHAISLHQVGNTNEECQKPGPIWDPFATDPMYPDLESLGDMGTVVNDADGNINDSATSELLQFYGPLAILGRSMVIWDNEEPEESGNNRRLACCIIGIASHPDDFHEH